MLSIYQITLRQMVRQTHLWIILMFAIISLELSPAFAELFAFGKTEVAVIDTLQATYFLIILLTVVSSSYTLLGRELSQRMAITLFTKPIPIHVVLYSKFLALLSSLLVVSFFLGLWILKQAWYLHWPFIGVQLAFCSMISIFFQGMMILSLSIALSISLGPLFAVMLTIIMAFAGFFMPIHALKFVCFIIPALPWFDLSFPIYTQSKISLFFMLKLMAYAAPYSMFMIYLSRCFLNKKDF